MKILLTGATGFIGSNIAKILLSLGFKVYATHRTSSSREKCKELLDKINWINTDSPTWKESVRTIKPDQIIHAGWGGVEAGDRNNWNIQIANFWYSKEIFDLAKECDAKKVIALGSQAEYGTYSFPVNETTVPRPIEAYGAVKMLTASYLRNLFENTKTHWYWLRIFSVFGEGENLNWLIPTVISKLINNEPIELTACEQQYNYMYIGDFLNQVITVIQSTQNNSNIYNICNFETIKLRNILIEIAQLLDVSEDLLQFGAIPYRPNQNMMIDGENLKFEFFFGISGKSQIGITNGLIKTIEYHKSNIK